MICRYRRRKWFVF